MSAAESSPCGPTGIFRVTNYSINRSRGDRLRPRVLCAVPTTMSRRGRGGARTCITCGSAKGRFSRTRSYLDRSLQLAV